MKNATRDEKTGGKKRRQRKQKRKKHLKDKLGGEK